MQKITDQDLIKQFDILDKLFIDISEFKREAINPEHDFATQIKFAQDVYRKSEEAENVYQCLIAIAEIEYPLPALHYQNL